MSKKHICFVSAWSPRVSFSTVLREIAPKLTDTYRMSVIALDIKKSDASFTETGVNVFPSFCSQDQRENALQMFSTTMHLRPDCIVLYWDLFGSQFYVPALLEYKRRTGAILIAYLPIDGAAIGKSAYLPFLLFDHLVFFTNAAKARFDEVAPQLGSFVPRSSVIGHGVSSTFTASVAKMDARENIFGKNFESIGDRVLILNANRDWGRKRIDETLRAFKKVLDRGVLDMGLCIRWKNQEVESLATELGISEYVYYPESQGIGPADFLTKLYSACELGINTAEREGWGLMSMEHAAIGAPQILPGNPEMREIWHEFGFYSEARLGKPTPLMNGIHAYDVDLEGYASAIIDARNTRTPTFCDQLSCYVQSERFGWDVLACHWKGILISEFNLRSRPKK